MSASPSSSPSASSSRSSSSSRSTVVVATRDRSLVELAGHLRASGIPTEALLSAEEVRQLIERARQGGAVVFVCEKDLRAERLQPTDLLPGIVTVDASDIWVNGAPSAADLKLKSICS